MAAGLTDHRWSLRDLLLLKVPGPPWGHTQVPRTSTLATNNGNGSVTMVSWGATGKSDRLLDSQSRRRRSDTAIGVGYLSTIKYDETIKVNSVTI
jgi:hypothetical protein